MFCPYVAFWLDVRSRSRNFSELLGTSRNFLGTVSGRRSVICKRSGQPTISKPKKRHSARFRRFLAAFCVFSHTCPFFCGLLPKCLRSRRKLSDLSRLCRFRAKLEPIWRLWSRISCFCPYCRLVCSISLRIITLLSEDLSFRGFELHNLSVRQCQRQNRTA